MRLGEYSFSNKLLLRLSAHVDPVSDRFKGIEQFASDTDGVPAKQVEHFRSAFQDDRNAGE
jgi:hypothetical protein